MQTLVISTNRNRLPVPVVPYGACMIAGAAEEAGHNVRLLDLMFAPDPVRAVEEEILLHPPGAIGLSVRNIDNNDMCSPSFYIADLLPILKRIADLTDVPLVLGGAAMGVMPEEIMRYTGISLGVQRDGEIVFPELLRRLEESGAVRDVPGLSYLEDGAFRSNPPQRLMSRGAGAAPDFHRWIDTAQYAGGLAAMPLQSKLGCQFNCVYCTYRKIEGDCYRLFPLEEVAESVRRMASSGVRDIEFVDNVFNAPYSHALSLCEALSGTRHGARLHSLELNPLFIEDELLELMELAGFKGIGITVESAADKVLEGLGKGFTAADVHRASGIVARHRLPCLWIFMLGGPGETEKTVIETLRFAEGLSRKDTVFFNMGVRIYPGTGLEEVARAQGLLTVPREQMLDPVFYVSPEIDPGWMAETVRESMNGHMNFINSDSIGMSYLPAIHRVAYTLGVRQPLWRYTRFIRRGLRMAGIRA